MLAAPRLPFPTLNAIVEVPVATSDGRIIECPGYDRRSRLYYWPFDSSRHITIPTEPTERDLGDAKLLLDEMLYDFAFLEDADRAHAFAFMFGIFVRDLIDGPTPLHNFEAPCPGTGKTLLVQTLLCPAVGDNVGTMTEARDEDEWRKRITANLREDQPAVVIDNLLRPLDSAAVSSVLTARQWKDRMLGKNDTVSLPVRTLWALTANNPVLSMEMARRCIRIRLDARTDRVHRRGCPRFSHRSRPQGGGGRTGR